MVVVFVSIHGQDRVARQARLLASRAVPDVHFRQFEHPLGRALLLLLGVRFFGLLHNGHESARFSSTAQPTQPAAPYTAMCMDHASRFLVRPG